MNFSPDEIATFFVYGNDADIVRAAEKAEIEMRRRAEKESADSGLIVPCFFAESDQEKALIQARLQLEQKYAPDFWNTKKIVLVPQDDEKRIIRKGEIPPNEEMTTDPIQQDYQRFIPQNPTFQQRVYPPLPPPSPRLLRGGMFKITDLSLEKLFVERTLIRRVGSTLYMYNGAYYQAKTANEIKTVIRVFLRDVLEEKGEVSQIKNVEEFLQTNAEIEVTDTTRYEHLICMENGILNLRTRELIPHTTSIFTTWQLRAEYNQTAECPIFLTFLNQITGGDQDLMQRIVEMIGYILLSPGNEAKRFFVLQGKGDTGKSVLGSLIASFFDETLVSSIDASRLGDRFSLSAMVSTRVCIAMDLTDAALKEQSVAILKQITGNDLVTVEQKYHDPYAARIKTKIIWGTNHILRANSSDNAFTRRIMLIPFKYPVPKDQQDPFLLERLEAERSGIFLLALRGYTAFYSRGGMQFWGDDKFTFQSSQDGDESEDLETGVEAFVDQYCIDCPDAFVSTNSLHQSYLAFCEINAYPGYENRQQFSSALGKVFQRKHPTALRKKQRVDGEPMNGYSGIYLVDTPEN